MISFSELVIDDVTGGRQAHLVTRQLAGEHIIEAACRGGQAH
jgi:hypothetical protein